MEENGPDITISVVDATTYERMFPDGCQGSHLYNSAVFTELMRSACDDVAYVVMSRGNSPRAAIVAGRKGDVWHSPFSAPFGGFRFTHEPSIELIDSCVKAVKEWAGKAQITLPPMAYDEVTESKTVSSLLRHGHLNYAEVNYHYPLTTERLADLEKYFDRAAKKNFARAKAQEFDIEFFDCSPSALSERAYAVIAANRQSHGYPLRMTLEQVLATAPLANSSMALLTLDGKDVAAALVQQVTKDIAQVVYWGDAPGFSHLRPMNMLAYQMFKHFGEKGFKILDIGPSSIDGVPNYGLCRFKESVGCEASLKYSFEL